MAMGNLCLLQQSLRRLFSNMCFLHRIDGDSLEEKLDPPMRQASNPPMPENKTNKIAGLFKGSCSVDI